MIWGAYAYDVGHGATGWVKPGALYPDGNGWMQKSCWSSPGEHWYVCRFSSELYGFCDPGVEPSWTSRHWPGRQRGAERERSRSRGLRTVGEPQAAVGAERPVLLQQSAVAGVHLDARAVRGVVARVETEA